MISERDPLLASGPKLSEPRVADHLRKWDFLVLWLLPFTAFFVTTLVWAYEFMTHAVFCIFWTVIGILACIQLLLSRRGGQWMLPIPPLTMFALCVGSLLGLYLYDQYTIFPAFYKNTRKYTNVVPGQATAAVADAGKITFSQGSFVDTSQSAGLIEESGVTYCVAPVRDGTGIARIQFWAAGIGCCGSMGEFYCDSAKDPNAQAGIVVFDNNGYFEEARYGHYEKARAKAQAQFALQTVSSPMYVRWVTESNLDMLANSYGTKAIVVLLVSTVLYLGLSFVAALGLYTPYARKKPGKYP